jgi:phage baseplate assembly protein W
MLYEIDTSERLDLNWAAKGDQRVLQNIRNLMSTWRYEVAYDRTKGLDPAILDKPLEDAVALYTAEIYRLIETYEPSAMVRSVTFAGVDSEGNITLKVVIEI